MNVQDAVVFEALGTTVWIDAIADPPAAERAVREVLGAVDLACSRFRSDSELSLLNASPGQRITIGPMLSTALGTALDAARRTDGIVDPTVGEAVRAIGYDDSFERLPTDRPPTVRVERIPGWRALQLDASGTVSCLRASASTSARRPRRSPWTSPPLPPRRRRATGCW